MEGRGFVFDKDVLVVLSSAKIVVVFSRPPSGKQIVKPQLFTFLSAGALVLTEDFPDIHSCFDVGKDIVGFSGMDYMVEKVQYYLHHPKEAAEIRKAGREKVLQHTLGKVWLKLLALFFGLMDGSKTHLHKQDNNCAKEKNINSWLLWLKKYR